jgi:hypothetical protein
MYEHWERVPIFGDRIKERFRQGKEEGREEGLTLGLQESIVETLASCFAIGNGKIARMVNSIDASRKLRTIFKRALKAESLDTVVNMLQKAKPTRKRKTAKV